MMPLGICEYGMLYQYEISMFILCGGEPDTLGFKYKIKEIKEVLKVCLEIFVV